MTYDPSHYKNNVEKLFNVPGKPLPLDQLTYWIDENEPLPKGKHLSTEAALAAFRSRSTVQPTFTSTDTTQKSALDGKMESLSITNPRTQREEHKDASDDRAMMASILAGMDMSPRALSLDGSDIDEEDEGMYTEDLGALQDTTAGDLFEGVIPSKNTTTAFSRTERDSRPEDLFGDDDDTESRVNQPLLSFLEDDNEGDDEDEDEEMKSADDDDDEEDEDSTGEDEDDGESEDEDEMDDDTIEAIAQLHSTSSTSAGGLFDSDNDDDQDAKDSTQAKAVQESNTARLKALESRQAELEAAREKQNNLIASTLANIDSRDKKAGHVVFSDSDDYDSEDYEKMEADHAKKMASLNKPAKSIFDSDSGSDDEQQTLPVSKKKGVKEMFDSDDEDADIGAGKLGGHDLNIKEQFEGPGGKALFKMQTKIGTSDSRFQLTKDFLDDRIREEDDADYVAHQDLLKAEQAASSGNSGIVLDEDRQAESDVAAEKMQLMNVLRSMFGDSAVKSKKKEEDTARQARGGLGFTIGLTVRYDPDTAPPPPPPTVPATQTSKTSTYDSDSDAEDDASEHHSDQEDEGDKDEVDGQEEEEENAGSTVEDAEDDTQPSKKSVRFSFAFDAEDLNSDDKNEGDKTETTSTASSTVTKKNLDISTKFQVASDLKSLFAPSTGTFKLFGGDDDDDEEEENDQADDVEDDRPAESMEEDRSQDEILTSYTDGARTIFTSGADAFNRTPLSHSGTLFFFHFKNPSLLARSNFKTSNKVFMRTTSMDEVTAHWEKTRRAMTQEFKRKHKSASRNKARASKRLKTTGSEGGRGGGGGGDHSDFRS
ncbi:hypothetical protein BGX34_000481 [Mortierella sp. NVP85]|nr:hypothetical protein BGX34_000481 [Mortierella sp. NVP85]